jgi:hypothetical protein
MVCVAVVMCACAGFLLTLADIGKRRVVLHGPVGLKAFMDATGHFMVRCDARIIIIIIIIVITIIMVAMYSYRSLVWACQGRLPLVGAGGGRHGAGPAVTPAQRPGAGEWGHRAGG